MASKQEKAVQGTRPAHVILTVILIIGGLFVLSVVLAGIVGLALLFEGDEAVQGNVAIVEVKGTITGDGDLSAFADGASASTITRLLREADDDEAVKAVIIEINSGGGTPVASAEIAAAVSALSKPSVAWIRDVGASGAYWVASSADHVVAHPLSVTGSIGVQGSYLEFSGLLERYNVTYERLVAGDYKDAGSPLKGMTPAERALMEQKLQKMHEVFIGAVAQNRNLSVKDVSKVADGFFLLGSEALDTGLVDELGGYEEVVAYLEEAIGEPVTTTYLRRRPSFSDLFFGLSREHGFAVGEGLGSSLQQSPLMVRT